MRKTGWIILDFVLATMVAILSNIVTAYLQEQFGLTGPTRFIIVAVIFVVCLGLLLFATLVRAKSESDAESSSGQTNLDIEQRVDHVEGEGKLTGVEVKKIPGPGL